jgi:nicotinamidase-related amidase
MKKYNEIQIPESITEIIKNEKSCLVVWDVQNALVNRIFNKPVFLEKLKKLLAVARDRVPIFYTVITPLPKEFQSSWSIYSMMRRFKVDDPNKLPNFMAPGSNDREIPMEVFPQKMDVVMEKSTPNIFLGTNFESMLRNRGIETIIFTGIATEMGIEHSARDASARGFYPVVVSDAVSSMDPNGHERSLITMQNMLIVEESEKIMKILSEN